MFVKEILALNKDAEQWENNEKIRKNVKCEKNMKKVDEKEETKARELRSTSTLIAETSIDTTGIE